MAQFVDRANQTGSKYYRLTLQNEFRKIKRGLSKKEHKFYGYLFVSAKMKFGLDMIQ